MSYSLATSVHSSEEEMKEFVVPRKELLVSVYFGSSGWDASSPPPKINVRDIPYYSDF